MKEEKKAPPVEVVGTLNVQRLYDTLARILSAREGVNITVKATRLENGVNSKVG